MTNTNIVPIDRMTRVALKEAPLKEMATELLEVVPLADVEIPEDMPAPPESVTITPEVRKALKTLSSVFGTTVIAERRTMTPEEIAAIGVEYEALKGVSDLLKRREEYVKEVVRIHQDVEAEEAGIAHPRAIRHNGNVIAEATVRDPHGHYLLAAKGAPRDTPIPGTNLRFSVQFSSGRATEDLGAIQRAYEAGELDEATWKAVTVIQRVPTAEKVRAYVLRTGRTSLLSMIVRKGRDSAALYLRAIKKK